uniref:Uncharacterized protein n=1 Tax=Mycena chlorophos TaxID=658473 RepID=A0ABQ0LW65_MYCCL|nr:predicted protein [Mycena chlorophos]
MTPIFLIPFGFNFDDSWSVLFGAASPLIQYTGNWSLQAGNCSQSHSPNPCHFALCTHDACTATLNPSFGSKLHNITSVGVCVTGGSASLKIDEGPISNASSNLNPACPGGTFISNQTCTEFSSLTISATANTSLHYFNVTSSLLPNSTNVGPIPQTRSVELTNRRMVRRSVGSVLDQGEDHPLNKDAKLKKSSPFGFQQQGLRNNDKVSFSQCTPSPTPVVPGGNTTFTFEGDRIVLSGTTVPPSNNSNSTFELTIGSNPSNPFSNAYSATLNGTQIVEGQMLFYAAGLDNTNHTATIRVVSPSAQSPAGLVSMEWRGIGNQCGSFEMDTTAVPLPSTATVTESSSASPTIVNPPAVAGTSRNPFASDHMVAIIVPSILGFVLLLALGYILYLRLARRRRRRLVDDSPADSQTDPEEPTNIPVDISERPDSSLAFWEHAQAPNDFAVIERTGTGTGSPGPGALVAVIPSDQRVESRFYEPLHWMGSSAYASASLPVSEHDEALSRRTSMSHPASTVTRSSAATDKTMTNVYGYSKTATDSSKSRSSDSMYSEGSFGGQLTGKQLGRRNSQLSEHSQSDQSSVNTVYAM